MALYIQLVDNAGNILSVFNTYWTTQPQDTVTSILNPANLFYTTPASNSLLSAVTLDTGSGSTCARIYAGPTGWTSEASAATEIVLENASNSKVYIYVGGKGFLNPTSTGPNQQLTYADTKVKSGSWLVKLRSPLYRMRSNGNVYVSYDPVAGSFNATPDATKSTLLELFNGRLYVAGSFSVQNSVPGAIQVNISNANTPLQGSVVNLANVTASDNTVTISPVTQTMQILLGTTNYFVSETLAGVLVPTTSQTNLCFLELVTDATPSNLIVEAWPLSLPNPQPFPFAVSSGYVYGSSSAPTAPRASNNNTLYYILGGVGGALLILLIIYIVLKVKSSNRKALKGIKK
jgi:hypothetical protein